MSLAYRNLSQNAAVRERLGDFTEAADFWKAACANAHGSNQEWASNRADFCQKMAKQLAEQQPQQ